MNIDAFRSYFDAAILVLMFVAALSLVIRALGPGDDE